MKQLISNTWTLLTFCLVLSLSMVSCMNDDNDTIILDAADASGIPSDSQASPNPEIDGTTTPMPNVQYTIEDDRGYPIVRLDMTGVQDPSTLDWLKLYGTGLSNQNVWVSVDGKPKGILVINSSDEDEDRRILSDLVFLVDNSGSMSEEADAIARDIRDWAKKLEASRLDIRFGCVGYSVSGSINGALDITDATTLGTYLDRSRGTSRTEGFSGSNATTLQNAAKRYGTLGGECGAQALRFADENMGWRLGANRVFVNFTDEPNQPNGRSEYSTEYFKDASNWPTYKGTVHTVYSSSTNFSERIGYNEYPWRLSEYTGGTFLTATSSFTGVTLESLPVTGALQNSYIIRFTNIRDLMDGQPHEVKVTILSADGQARAERTFYIIFGNK